MEDLRELCAACNAAATELKQRQENGNNWDSFDTVMKEMFGVDPCEMPTFGGTEPDSTDGIFSWDETHYLIPGNEWALVDRST